MQQDKTNKWWESINWKTNCYWCGNPVAHGVGWSTIGMCANCVKIKTEDMLGGWKQNRLRQIMIDRGEILQKETV